MFFTFERNLECDGKFKFSFFFCSFTSFSTSRYVTFDRVYSYPYLIVYAFDEYKSLKDWRKSKNAFCLQRTNFTMFHYADDTNELGFRTDSERSAEVIKFRTEPIPKKFLHSVPNRTES